MVPAQGKYYLAITQQGTMSNCGQRKMTTVSIASLARQNVFCALKCIRITIKSRIDNYVTNVVKNGVMSWIRVLIVI